jgi:two-component system sensor histidine kinase RegB
MAPLGASTAAQPQAGRIGRGLASEERGRLNLSWLVQLHWWAILGQILIIAGAELFTEIELPMAQLVLIILAEAAGNVALGAIVARVRVTDGLIVLVMLLDAVVLTVILDRTGGAINPFSTLYLVNVGLAAVLLPQRWAWTLMFASLAAYASLFVHDTFYHLGHHVTLHGTPMEQMAAHLRGGWVAFSLAAFFTVYFVQRVASALHEREGELRAARALVERREKLASLATLAAGAAHELSTPLSTIAVVAKELQRALGPAISAEVRTDLELVRDQVARCREILDRMSANAGEAAGEPLARFSVPAWLEAALDGFGPRHRIKLEMAPEASAASVEGPPRALADSLRGLLKNAVQASGPELPVTLRFEAGPERVAAVVVDFGRGMAADVLARVGEPFFTTKVPGEGMGLGLFLTRTLAEQLGGDFHITSRPGIGTEARIELPAAGTGERSGT